jgi:hypothetical protein
MRCLATAPNAVDSSASVFTSLVAGDCPAPGYHWLPLAIAGQYSLPTHNSSVSPKSKSKLCYDRRSVGQSVLVSSTHLRPKIRFLLLSDSCGFPDVRRPLWREGGSVVYNYYWSSGAQSFSGSSPVGLRTIFYSLRFETPPTWRTRSPRNRAVQLYPQALGFLIVASYDLQGYGGGILIYLHEGISSLRVKSQS